MGARGPAPTPTKVLEARGSWRAKKRRAEPVFPDGVPPCPEWMPKAGREEWLRVVAELSKVQGVLQQVDWSVLALYCDAWADFVSLAKASRGKNRLYLISSGLASQKSKRAAEVSRYAQQFGFTPASRARVQKESDGNPQAAPQPKAKDAESRFFGGLRAV